MNPNFRRCLEQNKIYLAEGIEKLARKELVAAQKDLSAAGQLIEDANYKWSTTMAYYAMFHAARSLLYSEGYKERSHYCLLVAIDTLFVDSKKLSRSSLEIFQKARRLREAADYQLEYSEESAQMVIKGAKKFIKESKAALKNLN